jgi:SPP1 family predicted phage head-tail adaptor
MTPAGNYRHAVNIEQLSGSGSDGMGNTYQAWAALYSGVMAQIKPLSSSERWNADRGQSLTTHRVTMRYLPGLTSAMRLKFEGRYFSIRGIVNTGELNAELVIDCAEGNT